MPMLGIQDPNKIPKPQPICACCGAPRSAFSASHCKACYSLKTRPATFAAPPLPEAVARRREWIAYYSTRYATLQQNREIRERAEVDRQLRKIDAAYRSGHLTMMRAEFQDEIKRANALWREDKLREIVAQRQVSKKEKARQSAPSPAKLAYPYVSAARSIDGDLLLVNALVPHMEGREDVCQEIMIALWEKRITLDEVKSNRANLRKFISEFRRDNYEAGGYAVSLDQPMHDGRSWHDVLVDPNSR